MGHIAVQHPRDPGRPWVIPADRYDPATHVLWGATEPAGHELAQPHVESPPLPVAEVAPGEQPWWETEQ